MSTAMDVIDIGDLANAVSLVAAARTWIEDGDSDDS